MYLFQPISVILVVVLVTKLYLTVLRPHGLQSTRFLCPWDSPGKNTGVACHFFLQGIFPAQRSNPCLLHWQVDSLPLSHPGSPSVILIDSQIIPSLACRRLLNFTSGFERTLVVCSPHTCPAPGLNLAISPRSRLALELHSFLPSFLFPQHKFQ